jgi:4-amino-4-deoxy-L-arabinose transferase-like glycosyltransferase
MTSFLDGVVAAALALILNLWIVVRIRRAFPREESTFLSRIYWLTIGLRYVGALWLNAYSGDSAFADAFWGDSSTYDIGGYLLANGWSGENFVMPINAASVSGYGFIYFVGLIYFVVGRNQLFVQFVNGTIGSVSVIVLYAIARKLFGIGTARWAGLFMAFFPQMIFWSFAMYKDPSILLCITVSIYAVLNLRERLTPGYVTLFIASCLYLMSLRFYVFYMVAFATLGTFVFGQRRGIFTGLVAQSLLISVFIAALFFGVRSETFEQQSAYLDLEKLQNARAGQATLGKSAFGADINVSTTEGALTALPIGLVYLLFAPFPWAITGLRQLLTLPETLVWYALMPALVRGLIHTVRHRLREALPILVFALILTTAYAIFQSNVGTAYRQRTQITMFFFIFMGAGIEVKRARVAQSRLRTDASVPAWQR